MDLILGQEGPLEEEMPTRTSILAWKIPWTEEPREPEVHRVANGRTQLSDRGCTLKRSRADNAKALTSSSLGAVG